MKNHGAMNDTSYWWQVDQSTRDELVHRSSVCNITAAHYNIGAAVVEVIDLFLRSVS
jgi:hypothetical protein